MLSIHTFKATKYGRTFRAQLVLTQPDGSQEVLQEATGGDWSEAVGRCIDAALACESGNDMLACFTDEEIRSAGRDAGTR